MLVVLMLVGKFEIELKIRTKGVSFLWLVE